LRLSAGAFARTLGAMQRALWLGLLVLGCHTTPSRGDSEASANAPSNPWGAQPGASTAAPPVGSAPGLSKDKLTLSGGGTLTLPQGAKAKTVELGKLPKEVAKAHLFELGGDKRLLMVNEFPLEGKTCKERLDEEWKRMTASKGDSDPTRLKFRRMRVIDDVTIAGHRTLYIEFEQRGLAAAEEQPKAAMASMTFCRDKDHGTITFASPNADLPPATRAMLESIIKSYAPPG
jgi:hypothetical protein